MKTSPFCKNCNNHRPKKCTCKLNLIQIKFIQNGKYRKSCTAFDGGSEEVKGDVVKPENNDLKNSRQDFLSALDCYYEFVTDHKTYVSVYDFFTWCRKKINI